MAAEATGRRGRPPQGDALYRQLAGKLRQQILAGAWPAGQAMPSLRALAREHRVGQSAVRRAVGLLKREGRIRIGAGRRMLPSGGAGSTAAGERMLLAVVGSPLDAALRGVVSGDILRGVGLAAGRAGMPLLLLHGEQFARDLPSDLASLPAAGIVLVGEFPRPLLVRYDRLRVPVVVADSPVAGFRALHAVSVDNGPAPAEAVGRLLELGHRRMAFVRNLSLSRSEIDPDGRERAAGFRRALAEAGVPAREQLVIDFYFRPESLKAVVRRIRTASPPITAVLFSGSGAAERFRADLTGAGIRIPGDLSLAAFGPAADPKLTISGPRADFEEIGRQAVLIVERPGAAPTHVRVPARWAGGETVAENRGRRGPGPPRPPPLSLP